jgi:hypothetical protein
VQNRLESIGKLAGGGPLWGARVCRRLSFCPPACLKKNPAMPTATTTDNGAMDGPLGAKPASFGGKRDP